MKKILLLSLLCVFLNSQIVFANSSNVKIKAYDFVNAVIKGDVEAVKNYIELGANINKPFMGSTPLVYAIDKHQDEMLDFLLEKGANPNTENGTPPLYYAVVEKNKYAVAKSKEGILLNPQLEEEKVLAEKLNEDRLAVD